MRLYSFLIGKPGYFYFIVPGRLAVLLVIPAEIVEEEPSARPEEPFRQDDSEPVSAPVLGAVQEDEVVFRLDRSGRVKALLDFGLQEPGVRGKLLIKRNPAANPDLSSGLMAGAEGRLALFVAAILASGYDNGPAAGPGGRGSTGPGVL